MLWYTYCPLCAMPLEKGPEDVPVCPKGHFTQYQDVSSTANIAPIKNGKVLLCIRGGEPRKGTYDLVGGFINPGETGPEAAHREALEETNAEFKIGELFGTYPDRYETQTQNKATLTLIYFAEYMSGELKASDDAAKLEWHPIDNLPPGLETDSFPAIRQFAEDLRRWHQSR